MKKNRSIFVRWQSVILALVALLYGLLEPAYCQYNVASLPAGDTVLLMQQPDSRAGAVTPDVGVHYFGLDTEVLLTAVPKPGYYFVYWIGDVSDPTSVSTLIYMDAPKIVVAVFARSEFEFLAYEAITLGGYGGLHPRAGDYSNQGYTGGGRRGNGGNGGGNGGNGHNGNGESDVFPVPPPPEEDEFPVPTPEPATMMLLGLGSLLLVKYRTKN